MQAIKNMQAPTDVSRVRRFLGVVNQMSKFIPNLAEVTHPLRELLVKDRQWVWEEPQKLAFHKIKEALSISPVLALFDPIARPSSQQMHPRMVWVPCCYSNNHPML